MRPLRARGACLAHHFHMKGHVHCTCGMHSVHACLDHMSPLGGSSHTRHMHLKQWPPCMHKACTLRVQLVHVVMSPCNLLPQQAHVGSVDVGLKKDDIDEPQEAEAAGDGRGSAWGSSKENSQPLALQPLLAA